MKQEFWSKTAMSVNEALNFMSTLKMLPPNYPLYHDLSTKLKELLIKRNSFSRTIFIDEFLEM